MANVEATVVALVPLGTTSVLVLKEKAGDRTLQLIIDCMAASELGFLLNVGRSARPLWPNLYLALLADHQGKIVSVSIDKIESNAFLASVNLEYPAPTFSGEPRNIHLVFDARPSDAIAIATVAGVPVLVEESLFELAAKAAAATTTAAQPTITPATAEPTEPIITTTETSIAPAASSEVV